MIKKLKPFKVTCDGLLKGRPHLTDSPYEGCVTDPQLVFATDLDATIEHIKTLGWTVRKNVVGQPDSHFCPRNDHISVANS